MATPLLQTKLHIPPTRPELVPRPRLMAQLNAGMACRLILVSAPAGFGKTTLVTEWLSHLEEAGSLKATHSGEPPLTWLSLDENDNDPARFLAYLLAALQNIDPGIGRNAQAMIQAPQPPPPESFLTSVMNDIAVLAYPFVLVLDDYHLIHAPSIHQQLTFLLEHQPPQMHLTIITREDPPLPLSRWRARGQTVEVRQADLVFTEGETADFLQRVMQLQLAPADITALQLRTEGWVAGLQLAALSFRGRDNVHQLVQSFSGSHRYILDYLIGEVFGQQTGSVQDFLLKTSVLDRFTARLCDAVTQRDDSQEILLGLDQANLFVVPLDQSRQWYRYHHLFAELLRQQLRATGMYELVPILHKRASQWHEAEGLFADAIEHALSAAEWKRAADLIVNSHDQLLKRGEMVTVLRWFRSLPEEVVYADPRVCFEFSWPLILTEQIDTAELYLARAEQAALENEDGPLLCGVIIAQAHVARTRGDYSQVIELSQRALSLLPGDELSGRSVVALNLGLAQWYRGRLGEAEQALSEAQRAGRESGNAYIRWTAAVFLNKIQAAYGRLHRAAAGYRRIIQQGGRSPAVAQAHYELSELLHEWNDVETAADHARQGIEISQGSGGVQYQAHGFAMLALIKQAQGETGEAQSALEKANQLLEHPGIPPAIRLYVLAAQAFGALARGDLEAASTAVDRSPELEAATSLPDHMRLRMAQARLHLDKGERTTAARQLEVLHDMASQVGWKPIAIRIRALQAVAASTFDQSIAFLTEALRLAEPEGYVRSFLDLGEPMAALLSQATSLDIAPDYVGRLLVAFETEADKRGRPTRASAPSAQPLLEPLTERELEVLPLLAAGLTRHEIAQVLCVSINTVKAHLKSIYGKLDVHNRREAIARAQELGLLS